MDSKSPVAATAATLNVSCPCTECTTFLYPILPPESYHPRNYPHFVVPAATTPLHPRIPVWLDKLSLAVYDAQTMTPLSVPRIIKATNSQQQLNIITSTTNATTNIRSAFPKTPGTLQCSTSHCQTRIPVTSQLATTKGLCKRPLCDEHGEQFFDAEEYHDQMGRDAASAKSADISDIIDAYQRSDAESRWESNNGDGVGRPDLGSRTSSLASWRSFGSWESDDAGFVWDARAFDSKLCW